MNTFTGMDFPISWISSCMNASTIYMYIYTFYIERFKRFEAHCYIFLGLCIKFEQTVYEVVESEERVEVCVMTCSDISNQVNTTDEVIEVSVFGDDNVIQIPPGSEIASELPLV